MDKDSLIENNPNDYAGGKYVFELLCVVNGKSAIDWVIERYQKTMDKDSLIENNPNDYAGGKYVFELLCRVIKLSEKSVDLIEKISMKRFE